MTGVKKGKRTSEEPFKDDESHHLLFVEEGRGGLPELGKDNEG